jgi:hypothetical protein
MNGQVLKRNTPMVYISSTSNWYFFGWLTPLGGQPQNYPPVGDMMA